MFFTGEPAHISFYPDWGSCLLKWTASSDLVQIYDRAIHGAAVKNLTLEVNVAGTYYITLSTPGNKWADGSVGSVTFTFILKIAETAKPTMKMEEGVGSNRKDKYVNDTGQVQTVTFENCDPAYLKWESNGLIESEWDPVEKRLVLYQDKQNSYSISISIANPAACNWKGGGTASQGFTFTIGPRLINKMSIEKLPGDDGTVSGNTKIVQYDTEDQTLVLTPARRGSLNIITSMKYDYVYEDPEDEYGKLVFTTVDANRFDIIVYPASGHVWDDQSTTEYTFTFIIETIKIRAPYLDEKNVEVINGIKTKTVTYDPYGNYQTMRVQFYSEAEAEGVNIITAMTRNEDESTGGTVVLTATNATEYPINFTPKVNYEWAEGVAAPGFSLIIKRYQLGTPYVIHDDREDAEGFIENNTKTVGYQPNGMTLEQANRDKYLNLYVGIVHDVDVYNQLTITDDGLSTYWDKDDPSKPVLTFTGVNAKDYMLKLVPTENYQWKDGTFGLKEFKLVITPILIDPVPWFIQNESGGYDLASGKTASLEYDGTAKRFRIGNIDNPNEMFDQDTMKYLYVDAAGQSVAASKAGINHKKPITFEGLNNGGLTFSATEADVYIVRLKLKNTNYAWLDGSGVDFDFRFEVTAQPLAVPYLLETECAGNKKEVYDKYMYGIYDGNNFTMAIAVKYSPNIVKPELSDGLTQSKWEDAADYGRLYLIGTERGYHTVRLTITDTNFCWAEDEPYYEFELRIDFAQISGVDFFAEDKYEQDGEIVNNGEFKVGSDGSNHSSTFITGEEQKIIIRRSDASQFLSTEYQTQFELRVEAQNEDGTHEVFREEWNGDKDLTLYFTHANTYYVYITPTRNYSWDGGSRDPYLFTLRIGPKEVAIPEIYDYADGTVSGDTRKLTYNREYQQLMVVLGNDYKAYKVVNNDDMEVDLTQAGNPRVFAYLAKNAGTHHLRIGLADTYNYIWDGGTEQDYKLIIEKLAVDVPEAFMYTEDDYSAAQTSGTPISADVENNLVVDYTGKAYYVFLFGEVIEKTGLENQDVVITYAAENTNNENMDGEDEVVGATKVAWKFSTTKVNVYTITVSFPKGTANLYWRGTEENSDDKTFKLEIRKKQVKIPEIVDDSTLNPDQSASNNLLNDSYYADFTFNYGHRTIYIEGYLNDVWGLMSANYDRSLAKGEYNDTSGYYEFTTNIGTGGNSAAYVSRVYCLTLSIDYDNEEWDIEDDAVNGNYSTTDKKYYIRINKLAIDAPTIMDDSADDSVNHGQIALGTVVYTPSDKSVIYDGREWTNGLTILGLNSETMTYKLSMPSAMDRVYDETEKKLVISTAANANTYSVVISLQDPSNLCWDVENPNSDDLSLSLIVVPVTMDRVVVDSVNDPDSTNTQRQPPVYTPESKTVTFDYNNYELYIYNYLSENAPYYDQVRVEVISNKAFLDVQFVDANDPDHPGMGWLVYTARNAGTYTVRFTLTQNAQWDDGTKDPIDITLVIDKLQYETPFILPYDYPADPSADTSIVDAFTRKVTYALNSDGSSHVWDFTIGEYDSSIMSLYERTSTSAESITVGTPNANNEYPFSARLAGTYTVTFIMNDFENMRWKYADKETVTLTLVIEKLKLTNPVVDGDYLLNNDTLTGGNTVLNSVYDQKKHTALIENVLNSYYMSYEDTTSYAASDIKHQRTLSGITANNYVGGDPANGYLPNTLVNDVFGLGGDTTYVFKSATLLTQVDKINYVLFSTRDTGTYTVTFKIAADQLANMTWADGSITDKTVTIIINKFSHTAPGVASNGYKKQYTGDYVEFTVNNVYNGCTSLDEFKNNTPSATAYDQLSITNNTSTVDGAKLEVVSWYNGTLILRAKEVGTYNLTVSIIDTATTQWNTGATSMNISFTVEKRTLTSGVTFRVDGASGNTTSWSVNDEVTASITLYNVAGRDDGTGTGNTVIDLDTLAVNAYYVKQFTTDKLPDATGNMYFSNATLKNATIAQQPNGTYNVTFTFALPHGEDKISKAKYTFYVEQNGESINYALNQSTTSFTVGANPAPFDHQNLIWQYVIDNDPNETVHTISFADWSATTSTTPYEIPYLTDGGRYQFNAYMDATGMAGWQGDGAVGPFTDLEGALLTWKVKFVKYDGDRVGMYAGTYKVSIVITASDPDTYAFSQKTYTFWYKITPALYDISGLVWDYDPANPFEFDNDTHSVKLTGTFPTGLSVKNYGVTGKDLNTQIYAGLYNTSLEFITSNKNYVTPVFGDDTTYIDTAGVFEWVCEWRITQAYLDVEWKTKQSSDGSSVAYVPVLRQHGEKVDYLYEIKDPASPTGWREVFDFSHEGLTEYRVTATLKTSNDPATNYANNYILRFSPVTDNPHEFILDGSNDVIGVDVYVRGAQISTDASNPTSFKYDGEIFDGTPSIFQNHATYPLTEADNILVTYYSTINDKKPIPVPTDPGDYIVKLTLVNISDGVEVEYVLGDTLFYFTIEKGDLDNSKIYWQYTHTDGKGNTTTAVWDGTEWKNTADGMPITEFSYDEYAHTVELVSEDENLTVTATKNKANIHAGKYTSTALLSYESTKWNAPTAPTSFEWEVKKAVLDMSFINWVYDNYEYTISGGEPKKINVGTDVKLDNIPLPLTQYVSYETVNAAGEKVSASISDVGEYKTTCIIAPLPADGDYEMGPLPTTVDLFCDWSIDTRVLDLPVSNGTWEYFDGDTHDLRTILNYHITDWSEYFTLSVKFNGADYDGTSSYGYLYTAYDAGTYSFVLSLKEGVNEDAVNVVWDNGTPDGTVDDVTVSIVIGKAEINVKDWNEYMYASTAVIEGAYVDKVGETVVRRFIGYKFYTVGNGGAVGAQKTLDEVLNTPNTQFMMTAFIKDAYSSNIVLTFSNGEQYFMFTTPDLDDESKFKQRAVSGKPYISGYIMDDTFVEFSVEDWKEFLGIDEEYWKTYLEKNREILEARKNSAEIGNGSGDTDGGAEGGEPQTTADEPEEGDGSLTEDDWNLLYYAYELLTSATVYVTYSGKEVQFVVYNWDTQYVNFLTVWGGDSLIQNEAGTYSVTYMFNHNLSNQASGDGEAYYWSRTPDGNGGFIYDRSSVTLNFRIKYLMLDVPELEEVSYTGSEMNILNESLTEEELMDLLISYGDYVEMTGETGTDAGTYTLYLKIKDEFAKTVRWNNGTEFGQPSTYEIKWKILPIYIVKPALNYDESAKIYYDGGEHSVFEALIGYNGGEMSDDLKGLLENAYIPGEGSRGINADDYVATFMLPDSNHAWKDLTGEVDEFANKLTLDWTIHKKHLDMSKLEWSYDETNPFKYTYENGEEQKFTIELKGLPEELAEYVSYITYVNGSTNGIKDNKASQVGEYKTVVWLFENDPEMLANYELGSIDKDFYDK